MKAFGVSELKVVGETTTGVIGWGVLLQVDLLVLDSTPETFGKDVVEGAAFAIHADLDVRVAQ